MPRAEGPDDVAAAVAAAFAGTKPIGIGLWARDAGLCEADGTWQADRRGRFSAGRLLGAAAGDATTDARAEGRGDHPLIVGLSAKGLPVRTTSLAPRAVEEWTSQGVGSVFTSPRCSPPAARAMARSSWPSRAPAWPVG